MLYYKGLVQKGLSNLTTLVCSMGMCLYTKRIQSIIHSIILFCQICVLNPIHIRESWGVHRHWHETSTWVCQWAHCPMVPFLLFITIFMSINIIISIIIIIIIIIINVVLSVSPLPQGTFPSVHHCQYGQQRWFLNQWAQCQRAHCHMVPFLVFICTIVMITKPSTPWCPSFLSSPSSLSTT